MHSWQASTNFKFWIEPKSLIGVVKFANFLNGKHSYQYYVFSPAVCELFINLVCTCFWIDVPTWDLAHPYKTFWCEPTQSYGNMP